MSRKFCRLVQGINRDRSVAAAIAESGFSLSDPSFVHKVLRGHGETTNLVFFQPNWNFMLSGGISTESILHLFAKRKLRPDPWAHIRLMTLEPELALKRPSVSVWNHEGEAYSLMFKYCGDDLTSGKFAYIVRSPQNQKSFDKRLWFCGTPDPAP